MSAGQTWTVLRLINWTRDYFARIPMDEPRLAAEILLAHALGCPRMVLYTRHDRVVAEPQLSAYRDLVRRARGGEPVAYLVGHREFYSLSFKITPSVLVPRPETELLVDAALEMARARVGAARMWDTCTGSGCVGIAAAHFAGNLTVLATDVSEAALTVARENVQIHKLQDRVRVAQANLLALPPEAADLAPFDVITANPPYIPDAQVRFLMPAVKREPDVALRGGSTGLEHTERIILQAPDRLRPGGALALETGFGMADAVYDLLNRSGQFERIRIRKDVAGIERMVWALRKE